MRCRRLPYREADDTTVYTYSTCLIERCERYWLAVGSRHSLDHTASLLPMSEIRLSVDVSVFCVSPRSWLLILQRHNSAALSSSLKSHLTVRFSPAVTWSPMGSPSAVRQLTCHVCWYHRLVSLLLFELCQSSCLFLSVVRIRYEALQIVRFS